MDVMNSINTTTEIRITADSIILSAKKEDRPTAICRYCGSIIEGNRCESCGAPMKGGKPNA